MQFCMLQRERCSISCRLLGIVFRRRQEECWNCSMASSIVIRIGLGLFGMWACWSALTFVQVKRLDGSIRIIPTWSKVFMFAVGSVCLAVAVFSRS
jgi:hypothetical protein